MAQRRVVQVGKRQSCRVTGRSVGEAPTHWGQGLRRFVMEKRHAVEVMELRTQLVRADAEAIRLERC